MRVVLANKTAELIEKRSRFIASIFYIENVDEVVTKLNEIKKKYYDAKHNCFAYRIADIEKSSDDGEPSGTAGHPMLDILKGMDLTNVIAIVTRYFGGILLGTGGLQRAYSDSLKLALKNAEFSEVLDGFEVSFSLNYDDYNVFLKSVKNIVSASVKNVSKQVENVDNCVIELKKEFMETIKLTYLIPIDKFIEIQENVKNITKGRVIIENEQKKRYYLVNNSPKYI